MLQDVPVAAGQSYELSAWIVADPATVEHARARISWLSPQGAVSGFHETWVPGDHPGTYEHVTTGPHPAPPGYIAVRIEIVATGDEGPFEILVDDVSLQGPPAGPPATQMPTPTAAPQPTLPPASTPPPTPGPAPAPTATPTPAAVIPVAPPAPPTHTVPTPPPVPTSTPPPATPTPGPTPGAPTVFSELVNGGFELDSPDGPYGWRKIGGTIAGVASPARSGDRSLEMRSSTASTKWAYQTVRVEGGSHYRARAYGRLADPDVAALFLRVSWYASDDGSGEALSSDDSTALLETAAERFRLLDAGAVAAPEDARSAKVRLMLRPASAEEAVAHFDDIEFASVSAPPPTIAPTATATPPPGVPTDAPPAATPPANEDGFGPAEPLAFPLLTNASFEDVREDGTPYGWRKVGGEMAASDTAQADGDLSLQFVSSTTSTKWAYQAVQADPGRFYEFAGFAAADQGAPEVFLRLSWYASRDGSGRAISSDDSAVVETASAAFQYLTTGPIQAPDEAHSAKLRLMLRPAAAARAIAYFDALAFGETAAKLAASGDDSSPGRPTGAAGTDSGLARDTVSAGVLAARATPFDVANITAPPSAGPGQDAKGNNGDDTLMWLLGALAVPALGFALIGAVELARRRDVQDG